MDPQQPSVNQQYPTPENTQSPQGQFTPNTPSEPPKSKKTGVLAIIIIAVVLALGFVVFAIIGPDKKDNTDSTNNNSSSSTESDNKTTDSSKYQKYDVTDKVTGQKFSVSFYKNAAAEEKNGRTYLTANDGGTLYSVYLGAATGDKIDCGNSKTTTMSLTDESTTVCYLEDNTQYAGYATSKSGKVKINLAGQKAISLDEAKAIMESVSFN
ncbi:MAG TPA: hypothetical protein VF733_06925 [Candidatus Saccharimonadales bacterium]